MTPEELRALMDRYGYTGKRGASALGELIDVSYRSIYRYRSGEVQIDRRTEGAIRSALVGSSLVAARPTKKSKTAK